MITIGADDPAEDHAAAAAVGDVGEAGEAGGHPDLLARCYYLVGKIICPCNRL